MPRHSRASPRLRLGEAQRSLDEVIGQHQFQLRRPGRVGSEDSHHEVVDEADDPALIALILGRSQT